MRCQICQHEFLSTEPRVVVIDNIRGVMTFCRDCVADPLKEGYKLLEHFVATGKGVRVIKARGRCVSCGKLVGEKDPFYIQGDALAGPTLLRCMPCQNRIEGKDNADVSDIQGLKIIPQRRIPDERGTIMNILKSTDSHFQKFGEVYASTVFKDVVKGWSKHRDAAHSYACVFGRIKMVVYDPRKESPTFGNVEEIFLGPDNHSLVVIPPGLWNGFKGLAEPFSVVVICATHPHDPAEVERLAPGDESIPYNWRLEYK